MDRDVSNGRERLGGARADFVANLGKRRAEIKSNLEALRADAASRKHQNELRRRFHALGAAAKLLRFPKLAEEIRRVEEHLEAAAERGFFEDVDFGVVQDLVARMTSLAWGSEEPEPVRPFASEIKPFASSRDPARPPISALVVGAAPMADALALPSGRFADEDGLAFEVERAADLAVAVDLARALAPDVIVLDGDLENAPDVVGALQSDGLTEAIPVVVCLKVTRTEDAAPFMALGVAKTLPKPVSPGELRRTCSAVVATYVKHEVATEPLGELNVDQLGHRLAEELRRGLCDMVDPKTRTETVRLGEGTEVLAAIWGAVARVRDVVTIHSQGRLRFVHGGPAGAVPLAPWLENEGGKRGPRGAARPSDGSLEKTRIVVVDDDAAVCWFLAGVLKSAGATVYEARDGERALEIAKHTMPDLVVTDVLMPKLDGFSLCRMLKRDILLRDVPVVLLSWKEDLLQRVRELGADADGYLRKEASATAVVQRVRELVRTRQRVAQRIAEKGEVRGRLDGITTFSLLRMACQARPECTIGVRDATYLYEVEIRRGRPVRATRTSLGGAFERGPSVLGALLGVGDGRFVVSLPREDVEVGPVRADLDGNLLDQIIPVVAQARAAQRLLSGANALRVSRVELDEDAIQAYWSATPTPAREIVGAISKGTAPRAIVSAGTASARLLEDVLTDLSIHGGVIQVIDADGEDRLPEATAHELALLHGERAAQPIAHVALPTLPQATPSPVAPLEVAMPAHGELMKAALAAPAPAFPAKAPAPAAPELSVRPPVVGMPMEPFAPAPLAVVPEPLDDPSLAAQAASGGDVLAEPPAEAPAPASGPRLLTPPPAVVGLPEAKSPAKNAVEPTPTPSSLPPPPGLKPMLTLGSLHPPPVVPKAAPPKNRKTSPRPAPVVETARKDGTPKPNDATPRYPLPSAYLPRAATAPKKDRKVLYWVAFALVGVVFAVWARWSRDRVAQEEATMMSSVEAERAAPAETAAPAAGSDTPEASDVGASRIEPAKGSDDVAPEELPLRDSDKLKKGQGLLEVVTGKSDTIYIDGKPVGSGPSLSIPLKARKYEVRVKTRTDERTRFVEVKDGKLVRIRIAPPWQR